MGKINSKQRSFDKHQKVFHFSLQAPPPNQFFKCVDGIKRNQNLVIQWGRRRVKEIDWA